MRFADVIADGGIKARLSEMADSGMLGHALMLHEDEGGGALALTVALAQYLLCKDHKDGDSCGTCNTCSRVERLIYPDLHFVFPVNSGTKRGTDKKPTSDTYMAEWRALYASNPYFSEQQLYNALGIENKSGVIAVAESRKIIEKLTLTALEGYYKIMVVWLPERMNAEAANKLLKILEEPYDGTLFVLITHAPEKVMTTIASRCRCLRVPPMDTRELARILAGRNGISSEEALSIARMAAGSYGKACDILSGQTDVSEYLDIMRALFDSALSKDLYGVLEAGERAAALGGREKQKAFCTALSSYVRNLFLVCNGMEAIADADSSTMDYFLRISKRVKTDFFDRILPRIDRAYMLIDRNVSAKTIFCDLSDRFYVYM